MSSSKEYKDFIMEQLSVFTITARPMMGEYLLYLDGILFGGIYDDRLLVKVTDTNQKYNMSKALPYEGAKEMYLVSKVDDRSFIEQIVKDTAIGLKK